MKTKVYSARLPEGIIPENKTFKDFCLENINRGKQQKISVVIAFALGILVTYTHFAMRLKNRKKNTNEN